MSNGKIQRTFVYLNINTIIGLCDHLFYLKKFKLLKKRLCIFNYDLNWNIKISTCNDRLNSP